MIKKSMSINGHKTSVSLEKEFWDELNLIAKKKKVSLSKLVSDIDIENKKSQNLTSRLRVYCLSQKINIIQN